MRIWKKLSEKMVYDGYRKVVRVLFSVDGKEEVYDLMAERDTVCALVLTSEQTVILARQYRPGPEKELLELPGGVMDTGETPEEAGAREVLEETGFAGDTYLVGACWHDGYSRRLRHHLVITNAKQIAEQQQDHGEDIEVVEMSLDAFRDHLRSGQLTDAATGYAGLDHLGLL